MQHKHGQQNLVRQRTSLSERGHGDGPRRSHCATRLRQELRRQDHAHPVPERGGQGHAFLALHSHGGRHPLPLCEPGRAVGPLGPGRLCQGPRSVVAEALPGAERWPVDHDAGGRRDQDENTEIPQAVCRVGLQLWPWQHCWRLRSFHGVSDRFGQDAHAEPARFATGSTPVCELDRLLQKGFQKRGAARPVLGCASAARGCRAGKGHQADGERLRPR